VHNYSKDTAYRIGSTVTNLIPLKDLGIAPPDQVTFQPASMVYVRSDLSRVGDGFSIASWIWDIISVERLAKLTAFLNGKTFADVFIQTDMRDGTKAIPELAFKVYSAIMWKPLIYGSEGTPVVKSPYAIQTVNVQFVNLIEQSGVYLHL
jgi:hypothetical protein